MVDEKFRATNGPVHFGLGDSVRVTVDGGVFVGTIGRIDACTMTVRPTSPDVQRVFPGGYILGAAHWHSTVQHV